MTQRVTKQRVALREALEETDDFRSAQAWHEELNRLGNRMGLATVYRNLQALADSGEIDTVRDEAGEVLYRRCVSGGDHHHHLRCRSCGAAIEIDGPAVEAWAKSVGERYGYTSIGHTIELTGICPDCTKKAQLEA